MNHHTWGISGPHFASIYVVAMVLLALPMMMARSLLRGKADGDDTSRLEALAPEEIGLLTSVDAAVAAAIAGAGLSPSSKEGRKLPPSDIRDAVRDARDSGRVTRYADFKRDPAVRAALAESRDMLIAKKFFVPRWKQNVFRGWTVLPLALTLVGIARIVAGLQNGKPITLIAVMTALTAAGTWVVIHQARRWAITNGAEEALTSLRRQSAHLTPDAAVRGTPGRPKARALAPMSAALFGTAALIHAFPDEAAALDIPTTTFATMPISTGGSGSSTNSCSSGSSCGGGCGGSSSCGG